MIDEPTKSARRISAGLVVSIAACVTITITLLLIFSAENSKTPPDELPPDNAFVGLFNVGIGFLQFIQFLVGGLISLTLAFVGLGLSVAGLLRKETIGNRVGVCLSLGVILLVIAAVVF